VEARPASALYRLRKYVRRNRVTVATTSGAAALLIAFALIAFTSAGSLFHSRATKLTERDTVLLSDFVNKTGDPIFDDTLRQALTVNLGQSPFLNILSDRKTVQTLQLMGLRSDQPLTSEVARDLCQRVASNTTPAGSIADLGGEYIIGLTASSCAPGDQLATVQVRVSRKAQVLKARRLPLHRKLLKAYSLGVKTHREKGDAAALQFFQHATELDPNFAMAYRSLSVV
jgi:hypothetical protein